MPSTYHVGQRVSFQSVLCTVRYVGPVEGTDKDWLGVEWDDPKRGKHDGKLKGKRYFECLSTSKIAASFVRLTRYTDPEQSFVEAVHQKYATEITTQPILVALDKQHVISGKVVEEVGFDKIRRQLAQLQELKIVIVDGLRINASETTSLSIRDVCPKIMELDLSRNLFESFEDIIYICGELESLRGLRLNGNRFEINVKDPTSCQKKLYGIGELEMDEVLMPWEAICSVTEHFLTLRSFTLSSNHFNLVSRPLTAPSLVSLTLEYNDFTAISDLSPLSELRTLETLLLKGNKISKITQSGSDELPIFGKKLRYVDLSYNAVTTWGFVDDLANVFPGLEALRFSHNPIYDNNREELGSAKSIEEGYMLTLARLGNLKTLNFSKITTADRTNAEMYYLSRIGKAIAEVPEIEEHAVTSQHKRYPELCEIYGEPNVVRKSAETTNPDFLESRLISFTFCMPAGTHKRHKQQINKKLEIPKNFDIYRVKSIVGRAFEVPPLKVCLIWETGEWDPVAGYEDKESSDDEDEEEEDEAIDATMTASKDKGKWMKREVEIEDGTRQVGFCVDGMEAQVRVELR